MTTGRQHVRAKAAAIRIALVAVLGATGAAAATLPASQGFVNDFAGVLDDTTKESLTTKLRSLEKDTTAEVAVATVSSLDGLTVEDYAVQLFKQWGIGKKGINNGVLILVAPNERKVRIEVGYGLEPILPDGLAGEIIREQFLPKFRDKEYSAGLRAGVERIITIVRAKHIVTPEERRVLADAEHKNDWIMVPFFGMFATVGALAIGLGARTKTVGAILFGLLMGGIPFLLSLMFAPSWSRPVLTVVSLGMICAGFVLGRRPSWRSMVRSSSSRGGWAMGGGSSGSSSSGSSGGDFGGGSSGGGGASGSW